MNAKEFVNRLGDIKIDIDLLKQQGVSDQFITHKKNAFIALANGKSILSEHPVIELVENYDCSNLEIGMITFDQKVEETDRYVFFGKFEIDDLAIDKITGAVVMVENDLDHVIYECSKNDSDFLEAILNVAIFLRRRTVEEGLYEDEQLNIKMAEEFGDIAGGTAYYDFYKMMLGV